jgi:lipoyl(octanoyl) transferase
MKFFEQLDVYYEMTPSPAAINMAIDETLLDSARVPSVRFYRWQSPALSFGYFGKFADVADYAGERDLVRRWTGGGIVFHGEDLTYSVVIPAGDPVFGKSPMSIYAAIHAALRDALVANGEPAELAPAASAVDAGAAVTDRGYSCFANPVQADVIIDGRKVAGAAQRRTGRGLLQQGSIQHVELGNGLSERFLKALSSSCRTRWIEREILERAEKIAAHRYGTEDWLRKR